MNNIRVQMLRLIEQHDGDTVTVLLSGGSTLTGVITYDPHNGLLTLVDDQSSTWTIAGDSVTALSAAE